MSMLEDMYQYLLDNGFEVEIDRLPDNPPDIIALYGYAGRAPIYYVGDDDTLKKRERPGLQVQSRAKSDKDAEANVYAVAAILEAVINQQINGTDYIRIEGISAPYYLRRDEQERSIWTANFAVEKEL